MSQQAEGRGGVADLGTHRVHNQPPDFEGIDLAACDPWLDSILTDAPPWLVRDARALGERAGTAEVHGWSRDADRYAPRLERYDRAGRRLDEVAFHPAYHRLMGLAASAGLSSAAWRHEGEGGHLGFALLSYLFGQAEAGVLCPMTMSYAAYPVLRDAGMELWCEKLRAPDYDPRPIPAREKRAVTVGMAMTEKQGGSDVRANESVARFVGGALGYELTGHKWFCSVPRSDAFLTLAKFDGQLTCFFVPRWLDEGTNAIALERLKEKCGNRSNASSEIEYRGARARMLGEPGRGVATIIEMVRHTRLACAAGSAALMRAGLSRALHYARYRRAFGARLIEHELMRALLADLALEAEAALRMTARIARAFDAAPTDPSEAALARIGVTLAKYWICKRAPNHTFEAMECLGGNGYIEDFGLARRYREAPVNSIWEGSGNVIALDLVRALGREPECFEALFAELDRGRGDSAAIDGAVDEAKSLAADPAQLAGSARRLTELLAIALQACVMRSEAPDQISDAFIASRLGSDRALAYGAHPAPRIASTLILERALRAEPARAAS